MLLASLPPVEGFSLISLAVIVVPLRVPVTTTDSPVEKLAAVAFAPPLPPKCVVGPMTTVRVLPFGVVIVHDPVPIDAMVPLTFGACFLAPTPVAEGTVVVGAIVVGVADADLEPLVVRRPTVTPIPASTRTHAPMIR